MARIGKRQISPHGFVSKKRFIKNQCESTASARYVGVDSANKKLTTLTYRKALTQGTDAGSRRGRKPRMSDMTTEEWIEAEYPGLFADLKTHAENGAPEDFARLAAISLREHEKGAS